MNKFPRILFSLLLITSTGVVEAATPTETEYHCPSIQDIKYDRGTFTAVTTYNGVEMRWFTVQLYPDAKATIKKFNFTNNWNGCVGGMCTIYCVYEVDSRGDHLLKFSVSRDKYRLVNSVNGPWDNGLCETDAPETCTFTVAKNHW